MLSIELMENYKIVNKIGENLNQSPVYNVNSYNNDDQMFNGNLKDAQTCIHARNVAEDSYWRR